MKRISPHTVISLGALMLLCAVSVYASGPEVSGPDSEDTRNESLETDSISPDIALISDSGSDTPSLLNGVIPPSPQASELARYAEYPVGHTSGVPSVSVPLYEIDLGGFILPVSISYHASGARPDQIPTSVGLGWSLNAGG